MYINKKVKQDFYDYINSKDNLQNTTNDVCRITDCELQDNYIELACGHKFNYLPLYKEIKYQKTNKYALTYDYTKLSINQIKCPYCRVITNNILPYFKYYNIDTIRGVTYPHKYSIKLYSCQHIIKSTNSMCNNSACKTPFGLFCNKHYHCNVIKNNQDKSIQNITVIELKNLLRKNKCKVSGKKSELIERIAIEKEKNPNWID